MSSNYLIRVFVANTHISFFFMQTPCFCGSSKSFLACCEPIIQGTIKAETAEQLMRSRYSAYACVEPKYLMQTTHSTLLKNQNEDDIRS